MCFGMEERRWKGVYIVVVKRIWMEWHLMRVDKWSKRIMNLDPILVFRESWSIKFGGWWEWWASKMSKTSVFPVTPITVFRANFKKIIYFSILITTASFLHSNWSPRCLVSGKINLTYRLKIFWEISMKWWAKVICLKIVSA